MGRGVILIILIQFMLGCSPKQGTFQSVSTPLFNQPVMLRVVYAENPRFAPLTEEEITRLLDATRIASKKHLDLDIGFKQKTTLSIDELFKKLKPEVREARQNEIYDFRHGGDKPKLIQAFKEALNERSSPLDSLIAYALPYLDKQPEHLDQDTFAELLAETLIKRIGVWQTIKADDGLPLLDDSIYNEWVYWDSLGYSELPFDIVITNTLVASVEYYGQDIHTALRGGLTVGTTTNAKNSPFGGYIFWSTFPFTENGKLLEKLRGGETYERGEALHLSGTYLAHEIGHLLFHYGHPFESNSCIMTPVPMLRFKEWEKRLDPDTCRSGNFPAMQKGAAKIYFNPSWY